MSFFPRPPFFACRALLLCVCVRGTFSSFAFRPSLPFFFLPIMMIIAFSPFKRIIVGVHGAFVALPAVARVAGAIVGGCATRT